MSEVNARLVVFDFDHTLFRGDSGAMLIRWLIARHWQRQLVAALATPFLAPLFLWMESRRTALSAYLWIATFGWRRRDFDHHVDRFVEASGEALRLALIEPGLQRLHSHLVDGDQVVIATGAPPELVGRILAFVAHEQVPVVGTVVGKRLRAVIATHHCHGEEKLRMLRAAGYTREIAIAYTDSIADLPLLCAAREPVAINPKPRALRAFRASIGAKLREETW
jgi:phosphatidylglycerophosphatase C